MQDARARSLSLFPMMHGPFDFSGPVDLVTPEEVRHLSQHGACLGSRRRQASTTEHIVNSNHLESGNSRHHIPFVALLSSLRTQGSPSIRNFLVSFDLGSNSQNCSATATRGNSRSLHIYLFILICSKYDANSPQLTASSRYLSLAACKCTPQRRFSKRLSGYPEDTSL